MSLSVIFSTPSFNIWLLPIFFSSPQSSPRLWFFDSFFARAIQVGVIVAYIPAKFVAYACQT